MSVRPLVVKVGGSLYDLPELGKRLRTWLTALDCREVLLVPGGGAAANLIRDVASQNGLEEEMGHHLALCSLSFTAHIVAALLGERGAVIVDIRAAAEVWQCGDIPVLDVGAFAPTDENLPHTWAVTSDSLAARTAHLVGARTLVLLKSVSIPVGMPWEEAARRGYVDDYFGRLVADLTVRVVNLREWEP